MKTEFLIIGAGPCGLGAAWRLMENNYNDFVIIEKNNYPGGLSASITDPKGFTWDIGGHVYYSKYPYFNKVFKQVLNKHFYLHQRKSYVHLFDCYIPFPFQHNIHFLPKKIYDECLMGLRKRPSLTPKNYSQWLYAKYGKGIAHYFQIPYAKKLWAYPPEKMSFSWYRQRVAPVDVKRRDSSWGPNFNFAYPKSGGNGALWSKIASRINHKTIYNNSLIQLDIKHKMAVFNSGQKINFKYLLTTIPLDELILLIKPRLVEAKQNLEYSSVQLLGLGIKGEPPSILRDKYWLYFPDPSIPFYRANILTNFSPAMAPKKSWSILTESSFSKHRKKFRNIKNSTIKMLVKIGFIQNINDIIDNWQFTINKAYPIPTINRDKLLGKIMPQLEANNIFSRGRFGGWKYEIGNQDHAFMQGVAWTDKYVS